MLDEPTRWSSTYYMLQRFHDIYSDLLILAALEYFDDFLGATFPFNCLEDLSILLKCLKPSEEFIRLLEGEKYITISLVVPLYWECIQGLLLLADHDVAQLLLCSLEKRLGFLLKKPNFALCATALDPRFQGISRYCTQEVEEEVWKTLATWVQEYNEVIVEKNQTREQGFLMPATASQNLFQSHQSAGNILEQYKQFFRGSETFEERKDYDPIRYWKAMFEAQPSHRILQFTLECLFSIPATSAPSERVFSLTGNALSAAHSRMMPETLQDLVLISEYAQSERFSMGNLVEILGSIPFQEQNDLEE